MLPIEYDLPEFQFRTLLDVPISQIYGSVLHSFYRLMLREISSIMGAPKDFHVNSEIAIRKRLIKTPRSILTRKKPLVSFNVSINNETENGIFGSYNFNSAQFDTDILDPLSNVIFLTNDRTDKNKNIKISMVLTEVELNIETNVIMDSRQGILNLWSDWSTFRNVGLPQQEDFIVRVPLSDTLVKEILRLFNINDYDSLEANKVMMNYSNNQIVYERDDSTGVFTYFLKYLSPVTITPTAPNISNGELEGGLIKNAMITRPFTVKFNAPTKYHIDYYDKRLKLKLPERNINTYEVSVMDNYYKNLDYELDHLQLVFAGIKEQKNTIEKLNLLDALSGEYESIKDFFNFVKKYNGTLTEFFRIRIQNEDETEYLGPNIIFDEETFTIEMKEEIGRRITISIYVYKAAWNEYKNTI